MGGSLEPVAPLEHVLLCASEIRTVLNVIVLYGTVRDGQSIEYRTRDFSESSETNFFPNQAKIEM